MPVTDPNRYSTGTSSGLYTQVSTLDQLSLRYPGVVFGGGSSAKIQPTVSIAPGATVTLSSYLTITGESKIGSSAIVEGGTIINSTIDGVVRRGFIDRTKVVDGGEVTAGTVIECRILGTVRGGFLEDTVVTPRGRVDDGYLTGCIIVGTVSGGLLRSSIVPADKTVTSGEYANGSSSPQRSNARTVVGDIPDTSVGGIVPSSDDIRACPEHARTSQCAAYRHHKTLPPPKPKVPNKHFGEAVPPDYMVDGVFTGDIIIHEAVSTPNGDTYERADIESWITKHGIDPVTMEEICLECLRPNRHLQRDIDEWKNAHRNKDGADA